VYGAAFARPLHTSVEISELLDSNLNCQLEATDGRFRRSTTDAEKEYRRASASERLLGE
jgi:hypothetical protein